jgi:hypothetical protein
MGFGDTWPPYPCHSSWQWGPAARHLSGAILNQLHDRSSPQVKPTEEPLSWTQLRLLTTDSEAKWFIVLNPYILGSLFCNNTNKLAHILSFLEELGRAGGVSPVVESLPSKREAVSSNPSTALPQKENLRVGNFPTTPHIFLLGSPATAPRMIPSLFPTSHPTQSSRLAVFS